MRRLYLFAFVLVAAQALAFVPVRGESIGIVETSELHRGRMQRAIGDLMPRLLADELRRVGFDARLMTRTFEELRVEGSGYDYLVEVIYEDTASGYLGGVSAGIPVGDVGVGAEVAMEYATVDARVLLYDGRTFDVVRSFDLRVRTTSPAITGVGIGGRNGFLFVHLPLRRNPHGRVTRALARSAAEQIASR